MYKKPTKKLDSLTETYEGLIGGHIPQQVMQYLRVHDGGYELDQFVVVDERILVGIRNGIKRKFCEKFNPTPENLAEHQALIDRIYHRLDTSLVPPGLFRPEWKDPFFVYCKSEMQCYHDLIFLNIFHIDSVFGLKEEIKTLGFTKNIKALRKYDLFPFAMSSELCFCVSDLRRHVVVVFRCLLDDDANERDFSVEMDVDVEGFFKGVRNGYIDCYNKIYDSLI